MSRKKNKEMPRREEFLEAALTRFAKVGYSATSTREICADVGLVHSAIYNYFSSKEAVVLAIEEREMRQLISSLRQRLEEAGSDPGMRLLAALTLVFDQAIVRQEAWRLMADMIRSLKPRNRLHVIKRRDEFEGIVRDVLQQAADAGLMPQQSMKLASLHLFGLAEGLAGWFRRNGDLSRQDIVRDTARFALLGMNVSPEIIARLDAPGFEPKP